MMRTTKWFMALCAFIFLASCAALLGPRTIDVPKERMQEWMTKRFPLERRYLDVLEVSVAVPRLQLRPEVNRISTEFDVRIRERLFGNEHHGTIALNYGLRYEPSDHSVRLADVRVERFEVDGASALLHQQMDRLGVLVAEDSLTDRAIYTMSPKDVDAVQGRGYTPTDIRVTPNGLTITLTPQ